MKNAKITFFRVSSAFTLIELLIVIGILTTLAVAVVLIINPADLLERTRDSRRLEELASINKALGIATVQGITSFGTSNIVYVSIPWSLPDCFNLGLPSLPTGWSYHCSPLADYRKVTGSGWIPVDFSSTNTGSPLSILPVDPINSTSTGNYYTYVTGGSWELTTILESDKYSDKAINDGDAYPGVYSTRTSQSPLTPGIRDKGMVGYWKMDEGTGTSVVDSSGNGNTGSFYGSLTWGSGSNCVQGGCLETTGNNYVNIPYKSILNLTRNVTYAHWVKIKTIIPASSWPISMGSSDSHKFYAWRSTANSTRWMFEYGRNNPTCDGTSYTNTGSVDLGLNTWHFLVATYDGANIKTYLDGALMANTSFALGFCVNSSTAYRLAGSSASTGVFVTDEARVYNRALSGAEINAIYNATKP